MQWFRLHTDFATDPIVQSMAFEDQRHFIIILCLKAAGILDRKLSPQNRQRIINQALQLDSEGASNAKARLLEMKLIETDWKPKNWNKRQYLESHTSTERVRKYRKLHKLGNVPETLRNGSRNAPDTDTDTD